MNTTIEMPEARRRVWQALLPQARTLVARLECLACGHKDTHGGRIADWQTAEAAAVRELDQLHREVWGEEQKQTEGTEER
jgi:hypothetical protein